MLGSGTTDIVAAGTVQSVKKRLVRHCGGLRGINGAVCIAADESGMRGESAVTLVRPEPKLRE